VVETEPSRGSLSVRCIRPGGWIRRTDPNRPFGFIGRTGLAEAAAALRYRLTVSRETVPGIPLPGTKPLRASFPAPGTPCGAAGPPSPVLADACRWPTIPSDSAAARRPLPTRPGPASLRRRPLRHPVRPEGMHLAGPFRRTLPPKRWRPFPLPVARIRSRPIVPGHPVPTGANVRDADGVRKLRAPLIFAF